MAVAGTSGSILPSSEQPGKQKVFAIAPITERERERERGRKRDEHHDLSGVVAATVITVVRGIGTGATKKNPSILFVSFLVIRKMCTMLRTLPIT
jgi:hypothetical protein